MQRLLNFTREHYVEYYDLQAELADHLANAIEAKWQETPNADFEDLLRAEFKKFGIFGFTGMVEKRQAVLSKRYRGVVWHYFLEFFTLPKIMGTFGFIGLYCLALLKLPFSGMIAFVSVIVLSILSIVFAIRQKRRYNKKAKAEGRKWLFEEIIFNAGAITFLITPQLLVRAYHFLEYDFTNIWLALGFSATFVFFALVQYILFISIPKQAGEHLGKVYPEYGI